MHTTARYPAARTVSRRDSHSGPAGQLGRMKSRGAAVMRENRAGAVWGARTGSEPILIANISCQGLHVPDVKRVDVARAPRDCLKLNVGDKEPRQARLSSGPGALAHSKSGPSWPHSPPALPLTPDRATIFAMAVSFALFLPHLLPLSLLDSPRLPLPGKRYETYLRILG